MTNAIAVARQLNDRLKAWVLDDAFPLWWRAGADRAIGGFFEKLDMEGKPVHGPRRGRVLPRQIFSYTLARDLGWNGPWREAVEHGLSYYLSVYRRPDGLFKALLSPHGESLDDTAETYDQAFALFALASVAKVLPERLGEAKSTALGVLEILVAERKHSLAGFHQSCPPTEPLQSNPHMHLFEAMLAWNEVDSDPVWRALADEIAGLALSKFIHKESGQIREFFDLNWGPAQGIEGRICEPGHQFEWGWLLLRWSNLTGRSDARAAALRMIDDAEIHGIDPARGVAVNALLDDFSVHDNDARLWPQTERIKAAALAIEATGESKYWSMAVAGAEGLLAYLCTPISGLWRDKYRPDGTFVKEPAPASSFYHIVCAIGELDRVVNGFR